MIDRDEELEAAARAAFEEHEGPQIPPPPPPPPPSGVVTIHRPRSETVVRERLSVPEICCTENARRAARARLVALLAEGEWLTLGSVA